MQRGGDRLLLMLCNYIATPFPFCAGDITQKGYEKKKARLLGPYVKQAHESKCHTHLFTSAVCDSAEGKKKW